MTDFNDWNKNIIEEFRTNEGKVGGPFEGAPMLLLHNKGRKSGKEFVNPLMYQPVGDDIAIFASKGGAPEHPDWYHNVSENPDVQVELGTETVSMKAREVKGEERSKIWEKQKADHPGFAEYEKATTGIREIPVFVLSRS
jgi:deazaflavin-dependent oxidoreductase (nitroreductase family)